MKKWIRTLCLILAVLMVSAVFGGVSVRAAGGSIDMGDVVQLGDYERGALHIVFYPKELENSSEQWPVIVWANGTMCAPVLYTNLLRDLAAEGFVVVASSEIMSADGKDQSKSIDFILAENARAGSVFYGKIDAGRIAACGHSQGGASSMAPSPPLRKASLTAKPTSKSSQFLRTMAISSSTSVSWRLRVTTTGCPKPCMLRMWRFRFFRPSVSPLAFGSLM